MQRSNPEVFLGMSGQIENII